jgi:hypothetical protein
MTDTITSQHTYLSSESPCIFCTSASQLASGHVIKRCQLSIQQ